MSFINTMKLLEFNLRDFLITGHIGDLSSGISREQVIEIIGEPETWSVNSKSKKRDRAGIWKYGSLEIWFDKSGTTEAIWLYPAKNGKIWESIGFTGFYPDTNTDLADFEKYLRLEQLTFTYDQDYPQSSGIKLIVEEKAYCEFDETPQHKLYSIHSY